LTIDELGDNVRDQFTVCNARVGTVFDDGTEIRDAGNGVDILDLDVRVTAVDDVAGSGAKPTLPAMSHNHNEFANRHLEDTLVLVVETVFDELHNPSILDAFVGDFATKTKLVGDCESDVDDVVVLPAWEIRIERALCSGEVLDGVAVLISGIGLLLLAKSVSKGVQVLIEVYGEVPGVGAIGEVRLEHIASEFGEPISGVPWKTVRSLSHVCSRAITAALDRSNEEAW
jgi:hypothetical protein